MAPEDLDSFLDVSKDLRIKGLTEAEIASDGESSTKQSTTESSRISSNPVIGRHDPASITASGHAGGADVQDQEKMAMTNGFTKDQLKTEPGQLLKNDQVLATVEVQDDAAENNSNHLQDFDKHILIAEDGSFYCGICMMKVKSSKSKLRKHVQAKHFPNTFSYQCTKCLLVLGSMIAWDNHKRRKHPNNTNLSYVLTRKIGTQENIGQSEEGEEHENSSRLYEDGREGDEQEDDDSKAANKHENNNRYDEEQSPLASFEQHIIHLEGEKKYQCKICSDTSPSKNILLEHVETNHFANTVSYHCPTCGKNFGTYAAFRGHTYDEKHRNQY